MYNVYVNSVPAAIANIAYDNLLLLWPYDKFNSSRHGVGNMLTDQKHKKIKIVRFWEQIIVLYWLYVASVQQWMAIIKTWVAWQCVTQDVHLNNIWNVLHSLVRSLDPSLIIGYNNSRNRRNCPSCDIRWQYLSENRDDIQIEDLIFRDILLLYTIKRVHY